ncbi:unnamed protein product [Ceratitis capitata]|uniref:(Mediterranean fruit fly) hypothetical protein n=1 Tax=Ceratitis capitata TaxID=7213 RepID=A0A811ULE4_CERCA|nr:unnamed protein product [Ceratitis capitata]
MPLNGNESPGLKANSMRSVLDNMRLLINGLMVICLSMLVTYQKTKTKAKTSSNSSRRSSTGSNHQAARQLGNQPLQAECNSDDSLAR